MKIFLSLLATISTAKGGMKEWEVQNAYFADGEIILSDSNMRSNKQWHDCGKAPEKPLDGETGCDRGVLFYFQAPFTNGVPPVVNVF